MADLVEDHLARAKTFLLTGYSLENRADWITKHTFLKREPYSYKGHEFQREIVQSMAQELVCRKCSQIGLSETQVRDSLAMVNVMPAFTVIYTLPTAAFAATFARTRCDPVIDASPLLKSRLNPAVDNGQVKQFGDSFIYFRGTKGMTAAISVPADCLVHDEYDFSDMAVMSSYQSRLTHSPFKLKRKFSTPTVNGWGISKEFDASQQHWNMCKCNHCATWFLPEYEHVHIPGWDKELREITSDNIHTTRFREAKLLCPTCYKVPDLSPEYRQYVVKNPETANDVVGYQVQPFDAPSIITIPDLIQSSIGFERYVDFINFGLGLPAEDSETSFSKEELESIFSYTPRFTPYANVMGIDMGAVCYITVAGVGPGSKLDALHVEQVPVGLLEKRKDELRKQYKVRVTVMDSLPYFDMLMRFQQRDPNLWGAIFSQSKEIDVYTSTIKKADPERGRPTMRQVDLNRNKALDVLMDFVRGGGLQYFQTPLKDLVIAHLMDMKRIKSFNDNNELEFQWQKSAMKRDHFHHSLLYCYIASRLLSTAQIAVEQPNLFTSFKVKDNSR